MKLNKRLVQYSVYLNALMHLSGATSFAMKGDGKTTDLEAIKAGSGYPEIGKITVFNWRGKELGTGTGTLITSESGQPHVLTAAHVTQGQFYTIEFDENKKGYAFNFRPHPRYNDEMPILNNAQRDLAVVTPFLYPKQFAAMKLAEPSNIPKQMEAENQGVHPKIEGLLTGGYGVTVKEQFTGIEGPRQKRVFRQDVQRLTNTYLGGSKDGHLGDELTITSGDSGGPLFTKDRNIVGIVSSGSSSLKGSSISIFTRTDSPENSKFINDTIKSVEKKWMGRHSQMNRLGSELYSLGCF